MVYPALPIRFAAIRPSHSRSEPAPDLCFIVQISLPESSFKIGFFRSDDTFLQDHCEGDGKNQCPKGIEQNSDAAAKQDHAEIHWVAAPRIDARCGEVCCWPL